MGKPLSALKLELTFKVTLGPRPSGSRKKQIMSKKRLKIILWLQSCLNYDKSVFMWAFQKKSQNSLKVKKNYDQFLTQYASRLLKPIYIKSWKTLWNWLYNNFSLSHLIANAWGCFPGYIINTYWCCNHDTVKCDIHDQRPPHLSTSAWNKWH